ncbi:MAG: 16S rRNA (guanine(966)-N(2))-methyltransferase RsmD [Myxococcaceae bacterium]
MRIVAGSAKGRALSGPKDGKTIRPTADRVRETIFNILGQWLDGVTVLDLYAGTGALGLEALSRNATKLVMVDQDREALSLCRENAEALGFSDRSTVIAAPVAKGLGQLKGQKFDLVFADPPYAARVVMDCLEQLQGADVLGVGGTFVIEHDKREEAPEQHAGFDRVDQRRFGDTMVSFYKRT